MIVPYLYGKAYPCNSCMAIRQCRVYIIMTVSWRYFEDNDSEGDKQSHRQEKSPRMSNMKA